MIHQGTNLCKEIPPVHYQYFYEREISEHTIYSMATISVNMKLNNAHNLYQFTFAYSEYLGKSYVSIMNKLTLKRGLHCRETKKLF